jgi:hypothetical protein
MQGMAQHRLEQFGVSRTDKVRYAPLDEAKVAFECRKLRLLEK